MLTSEKLSIRFMFYDLVILLFSTDVFLPDNNETAVNNVRLVNGCVYRFWHILFWVCILFDD